MKAQVKPGWSLTPEQRERLRPLLFALHNRSLRAEVTEDDPTFLELLTAWEACRVPSDARPVVKAYHTRDGSWLTAGVGAVMAAIAEHVEGSA